VTLRWRSAPPSRPPARSGTGSGSEQAAREERDREWEDAWSTREGRLRDELYSRDELKAARRKALEEAAEAAMDQVCDNAGFWYHWLRARAEEEG
jgi:hypothetical protein